MNKFDDFWQALQIVNEINKEYPEHAISLEDRDTIECIINARDRVTPLVVNDLDCNEIFVFGSDTHGYHNGRASKTAVEEFGAEEGNGTGPQGRSYAIPTTNKSDANDRRIRTRTIDEIRESVNEFLVHAQMNKEQTFYVTRIGAGYAGFTDQEIAPLFRQSLTMKNIYLPQSFLNVLFRIEPSFANPSEMLPSDSTDVKSFRKLLDMQLSMYQAWLRKNYDFKSENNNLYIIDRVERLSSGISKAVDLIYRGLPGPAYVALQTALEQKDSKKNILWSLPLKPVEEGLSFYRMRKEEDNWEKKKVDKSGMFHIPYSLRHIVTTQRYSVPGYPSLYLGKHVFGCWEELGRPNLNTCLVSRLENQEDFCVADVSIPEMSAWYDESGSIKSCFDNEALIMLFPLIIACTFKSFNPKATFKPEYIIPQLLLQYVKEKAYRDSKGNEKKMIYGIEYTSVNIPKRKQDGQGSSIDPSLYKNYVIPVININNKNERCSRLCSLFKISNPVYEEYELIESQYSGSEQEYYKTNLGKIEMVLSERDVEKIEEK